ncbi:MAG: CSLREA domain-containing protein [Chloroflexi bacterium]|nr:CSLREA domain-containing protein [Chloroflexota bacterium]
MQGKWTIAFSLGAALLLACTFTQANAAPPRAPSSATFTVNSVLDEVDANPGDGNCTSTPSKKCTLRAAIMENNALGGNTIVAPAGKYILSIAGQNEDNDASGDLDITANLVLKGAGAAKTTIDANSLDRVLHLVSGKTKISGITITNGVAPTSGGGVLVASGAKLTLNNGVVTGNVATFTGGGILNAGTLTLKRTTVGTGNYSGLAGGGIGNQGTLKLIKSFVTSNSANFNAGYGGGLYNEGPVFINASTFFHDESNEGGAIRNSGGTITLLNSTLAANTAYVEGGAIYNAGGTLNLFNVTIAENGAPSGASAGGILNTGGGMVHLKNSLLDLNRVGVVSDDCEGVLNSQGYNLIFGASGCTLNADATTILGISSGIGGIANNGGPTPTEALQSGSVAIDYIPVAKCTENQNKSLRQDQRGKPRPADGDGNGKPKCDIGAYEVQP